MSIFSFNNIALSVNDVSIAVTFYQKVFGFPEIPNTASDSQTRWLDIGEEKQLHLILRPGAEITTNKAVHFALATAQFQLFVKHLQNLNIDYSDWKGTKLKDYVRKDGILHVYFQDPDGYWIEVNNAI